jgi:hypothetical protein
MAKDEKKNIALHLDTYERLSRLAAQLRIDNPGGRFVSMSEAVGLLLDKQKNQSDRTERIALEIATHIAEKQIGTAKHAKAGTIDPNHIDPDMLADDWAMFIKQKFSEQESNISLKSYIANAEANDPQYLEPENGQVIIKQLDGALYLEKMLAHNHNAYMTPHKDEAMVFDSHDQAKVFLRKCGHEAANWIIEPA